MPRLRNLPRCKKCGELHWGFWPCEDAVERMTESAERQEKARHTLLITRPRDGYREFGNDLGGMQITGSMRGTPILSRPRQPGEHAGSLRDPE